MRVSEKTLELTLCCQLGLLFFARRVQNQPTRFTWQNQPLWFGLTQMQEARPGFDAATRIGNSRVLLLQFKAGRRLKKGDVRFTAPHTQLRALRNRVQRQHRCVFYVLPSVTKTSELSNVWLLSSTWFLDVADIPRLKVPTRRSKNHHLALNPRSGVVTIASDRVEVQATKPIEVIGKFDWPSLGTKYDDFDKFWSYAKLLQRSAVAIALLNSHV